MPSLSRWNLAGFQRHDLVADRGVLLLQIDGQREVLGVVPRCARAGSGRRRAPSPCSGWRRNRCTGEIVRSPVSRFRRLPRESPTQLRRRLPAESGQTCGRLRGSVSAGSVAVGDAACDDLGRRSRSIVHRSVACPRSCRVMRSRRCASAAHFLLPAGSCGRARYASQIAGSGAAGMSRSSILEEDLRRLRSVQITDSQAVHFAGRLLGGLGDIGGGMRRTVSGMSGVDAEISRPRRCTLASQRPGDPSAAWVCSAALAMCSNSRSSRSGAVTDLLPGDGAEGVREHARPGRRRSGAGSARSRVGQQLSVVDVGPVDAVQQCRALQRLGLPPAPDDVAGTDQVRPARCVRGRAEVDRLRQLGGSRRAGQPTDASLPFGGRVGAGFTTSRDVSSRSTAGPTSPA